MKVTIELELDNGQTIRLADEEGRQLYRTLREIYAPRQLEMPYAPEVNEPWLATLDELWFRDDCHESAIVGRPAV